MPFTTKYFSVYFLGTSHSHNASNFMSSRLQERYALAKIKHIHRNSVYNISIPDIVWKGLM